LSPHTSLGPTHHSIKALGCRRNGLAARYYTLRFSIPQGNPNTRRGCIQSRWSCSPDIEIRPDWACRIAQISDGEALIDSGLQPSDTVVVDGQYKLQPDAHVTILKDNAQQEVQAESTVEKEIP
jgi:hypothetical protein